MDNRELEQSAVSPSDKNFTLAKRTNTAKLCTASCEDKRDRILY